MPFACRSDLSPPIVTQRASFYVEDMHALSYEHHTTAEWLATHMGPVRAGSRAAATEVARRRRRPRTERMPERVRGAARPLLVHPGNVA